MKYADFIPIHKEDDKTDKVNYCPISILPHLSKVYERLMYNQIYPFFDTLFPKFQCGFREGFNTQDCLLPMIEKWRKTLNKNGETGAVLTDLSKAFDCIDHNFLIAKPMPMDLKNNSLNSFIRTLQSVSKERKSILHTVRGKFYFRCPSRLYISTTTIQYIYLRYDF